MAPAAAVPSSWTSWTLGELRQLVKENNGALKAAQVSRLYDRDPGHWDVIQAAGSLKKFCEAHPALQWVPGSGPGHEEVREPVSSENRKKRIPRLAAAFAGALPDLLDKQGVPRKAVRVAWTAWCEAAGEPSSAFGQIFFFLVRWRALVRMGGDWFRVPVAVASNYRQRRPAEMQGSLEGQRPPLLAMGAFASPVGLYPMPPEFDKLRLLDVRQMQEDVCELLEEKMGLTPKRITLDNFRKYHHAVLFTEELQMMFDIAIYDLELEEPLAYGRGLYEIWVPGLAEKRPSVLRGDSVLLTCKQGRFKAFVHKVLLDTIEVSFHPDFANKPPFSVNFSFTRTPLRTMHRAVDELSDVLVSSGEIQRAAPKKHQYLNEEQQKFLGTALQPPGADGGLPILLWGPPGTGKTTTLVHTIVAIIRAQPGAKVLVTAPSNPASDLLCERLAELGVERSEMLRLVAVMRSHRDITAKAQDFAETDSVTGGFVVPSLAKLQKQRVIVATCTTAAYIRSSLADMKDTWFSHVFVDEAAQAMEAEVLVALTLRGKKGRLFLAGDWQQLGPVIRSPIAIRFGLQLPLMERIVQLLGTEHTRVFTLLATYRAHPSILRLYNQTVYAGMLRCLSPESSYDMERWAGCPQDKNGAAHPVIFHHCAGQESRGKDSPSWMNLDEVKVVGEYFGRLLAFDVEAKDIGIISPYHKQCQRLRMLCLGEGMNVEVGTTELFQGREKRVIIISTVRSREHQELQNDNRFSLGFLSNYKRTNVALSRARSLLIVVGNLSLLSKDATWNSCIKLVRDMRCLRGGTFELQQPDQGESSEWGQRARGTEQGAHAGVVDRPWRQPM